ncbi:conjugal transfer protein TraN, partial [Vibrio parahaemolyticus]
GLASGNYAMLLSLATQFLALFMCSSEEIQLDVKDRMGLCHYVGEYCSEK